MNPSPTNLIDDLRLLQAPRPLGWLWWVAAGLVVVGLVAFVIWRRAKARKGVVVTPEMIAEAQEDALAELEKLRGMISVKNSRPYAIAVSGVVRRYIERRFGIRAPKRSTEEFLIEAKGSALLDERHQRNLGHFLGCCDFLKFAKATAEVPELNELHEAAVRFVKDTQPEPEAQPVKAGGAQ